MRTTVAACAFAVVAAAVLVACADDGPDAEPTVRTNEIRTNEIRTAAIAARPCDRPGARRGVGTWISPDTLLTAAHVVEPPTRTLEVDGHDAHVVAVNTHADLAVVRIGPRMPPDGTDARLDPVVDADVDAGLGWPEQDAGDRLHHAGTEVDVHLPDGIVRVPVLREVLLRVDDVTSGVVWERPSLVLGVAVDPGHSGTPVTDRAGRVVAVIVLRATGPGAAPARGAPVAYATLVDPSRGPVAMKTLAVTPGCA